jgi:hypothetical protein
MAADDGDRLPGLDPEGEDDDDLRDDAMAVFGIDVGDGPVASAPIDLDGEDGGGANSNDSAPSVAAAGNGKPPGKRTSPVWEDFEKIYEDVDGVSTVTKATCKICRSTLSARSVSGTGHLKRHQKSCKAKVEQRARVQSRLALNPDGSVHNWTYKPDVARLELCRLIARLDLPLCIGETDAFEEYIQRAHNPRFQVVSRQSTTRDLSKLFTERRNILKNSMLPGDFSVSLTSDIWSENANEDYISVVAHYVSADWEMKKKVIGLTTLFCGSCLSSSQADLRILFAVKCHLLLNMINIESSECFFYCVLPFCGEHR